VLREIKEWPLLHHPVAETSRIAESACREHAGLLHSRISASAQAGSLDSRIDGDGPAEFKLQQAPDPA
jgi:hypothetical protein